MMNPLSLFYSIRSYVDAYAGLLGRRFLSVIWLVAIGIVVWFYGYLLAFGGFKPLEPAFNRIIAIAVLTAAWLCYIIYSVIKARRADRAMIDDIAGEGKASPEADARAEVEVLRGRLADAMALLRRVVKRRFGYVYELPWYLVIGAPGSGKTTSLTHSGLKFPLGDAAGAEPVRGVGGTRDCNWWFTEDAIFIDTAGRYTTQGDFSGVDKAGWSGFLNLLKKHRPSQPLNGAVVTLSIPDLLDRDPAERTEEIRNIRQRLSEMDEALGARVPIYLVLTKADLLDGFVPFFDGLARSDRDQVWGTTFPLEVSHDPGALPDAFLAEFDLLRERVGALLLERMQQEPDIGTRGRIFHLPAKMALLREPVHEVLGELCAPSKLAAAPMVRGVYMASGTQGDAAAQRTGRGSLRRSYFLSRLFTNVILEEAALVARDRRLSGRNLLLRRVALGAAASVAALVLIGWIGAYFHGRSAIAYAQTQTERFTALSKDIPVRDVADEDFLRVLPALDALAGATAEFRNAPLLGISFGLDQEDKVAGSHRLAYGRALNALLLPRLMVHLQSALRDDTSGADETFDALKLYGIFGGLGPMDAGSAVAGSRAIFTEVYPGEGRKAIRDSLVAHVRALVARPLAPLAVDEELVAEARKRIEGQTAAERALHLLRSDQRTSALTPWTPFAVLGAGGEPAFKRRSGASLREGVPGLYTRTGFRTVVVPHLMEIARTAAAEGWVRGREGREEGAPSDIARDALRLYFAAFEDRWRTYLSDLAVKPADTLAAMTEATRILSSAPYPLTQLAQAVADATSLSDPTTSAATEATGAIFPIEASAWPDPYGPLRAALAKPTGDAGAPSQIAGLQPLMKTLYEQLSRAASSSAEVAAIFDVKGQLSAANQALVGEARRLPAPADQWVGGLTASVDALAVNTARASLQQAWQADGARVCAAAIEGRYPFDRKAEREVAMDDFVRVFGPKGLFETFFETKLAPFVDTSSVPWRWKGAFGTEGAGSDALRQFGLARQIRQAFFTTGDRPSVSLTVTPETLDDDATAVILEVEGERVVYFHGPILPKTILWPSRSGSSMSRIVFQPGGWDKALSRSGPWSAMRLFDAAQKAPISDDRFRARFDVDGRAAAFEVQVGSILNPFVTDTLASFRCPGSL